MKESITIARLTVITLLIGILLQFSCTVVTHNIGMVRGNWPILENSEPLVITKDIGKALKEENPRVIKWLDSIDHLENRLELTECSDSVLCFTMLEYQIPAQGMWFNKKNINPLENHKLHLENSDGMSLKDPRVSELKHDTLIIRYTIYREVIVGQEYVKNSAGQIIETIDKVEWREVEETVDLHRFTGTIQFTSQQPFVSSSTKWIKLKMKAKLYANVYTFKLG